MKCKDCSSCRKGFFESKPDAYVCIGVKEPFVVDDIETECTEYRWQTTPVDFTINKIDNSEEYLRGFQDGQRSNIPLPMMKYYRKALRDAYSWLEARSEQIKHFNCGSYKYMMEFLKMFMENPNLLMEYGEYAEYTTPKIINEQVKKKIKKMDDKNNG